MCARSTACCSRTTGIYRSTLTSFAKAPLALSLLVLLGNDKDKRAATSSSVMTLGALFCVTRSNATSTHTSMGLPSGPTADVILRFLPAFFLCSIALWRLFLYCVRGDFVSESVEETEELRGFDMKLFGGMGASAASEGGGRGISSMVLLLRVCSHWCWVLGVEVRWSEQRRTRPTYFCFIDFHYW